MKEKYLETWKALEKLYRDGLVVLRWDLQNEVVIIPKSVNEHRMKENANIFDFQLSAEDMEKINQMNQNKRYGADPDNFDF